jgi:hypothetical protein
VGVLTIGNVISVLISDVTSPNVGNHVTHATSGVKTGISS